MSAPGATDPAALVERKELPRNMALVALIVPMVMIRPLLFHYLASGAPIVLVLLDVFIIVTSVSIPMIGGTLLNVYGLSRSGLKKFIPLFSSLFSYMGFWGAALVFNNLWLPMTPFTFILPFVLIIQKLVLRTLGHFITSTVGNGTPLLLCMGLTRHTLIDGQILSALGAGSCRSWFEFASFIACDMAMFGVNCVGLRSAVRKHKEDSIEGWLQTMRHPIRFAKKMLTLGAMLKDSSGNHRFSGRVPELVALNLSLDSTAQTTCTVSSLMLLGLFNPTHAPTHTRSLFAWLFPAGDVAGLFLLIFLVITFTQDVALNIWARKHGIHVGSLWEECTKYPIAINLALGVQSWIYALICMIFSFLGTEMLSGRHD